MYKFKEGDRVRYKKQPEIEGEITLINPSMKGCEYKIIWDTIIDVYTYWPENSIELINAPEN